SLLQAEARQGALASARWSAAQKKGRRIAPPPFTTSAELGGGAGIVLRFPVLRLCCHGLIAIAPEREFQPAGQPAFDPCPAIGSGKTVADDLLLRLGFLRHIGAGGGISGDLGQNGIERGAIPDEIEKRRVGMPMRARIDGKM